MLVGSNTSVSGYADGVGTSALLNNPVGLAIDPGSSNLAFADGNFRIRLISLSTLTVKTVAGSGIWAFSDSIGTSAAFGPITSLAFDNTGAQLFAPDIGNNALRKLFWGISSQCAGGQYWYVLVCSFVRSVFWLVYGWCMVFIALWFIRELHLRLPVPLAQALLKSKFGAY